MTVLRARALDTQGQPKAGVTATLEAYAGNRYSAPKKLSATSGSDGWMQWQLPDPTWRPGPKGLFWVIRGLETAPVLAATQPGDATVTLDAKRLGTLAPDGAIVIPPAPTVDTAAQAAAAAQAVQAAVVSGAPASLDTLKEVADVLNGRLSDTALRAALASKDGSGRVPSYRLRRPTLPGQMIQSYGGVAVSTGTAAGSFTFRATHRVAVPAHDIRFVFNVGHYLTASTSALEASMPNDIPLKASAEIGGVVYPITFNGARTPSLAAGSSYAVSDPLALDVAVGTLVAVRVFTALTSGQSYPVMMNSQGPGVTSTGDGFLSGSDAADSTAAMGTTQAAAYVNACAIVGEPVGGPTVVIGGVGDSVMSGQGETATGWGFSWLTRGVNGAVPLYRYSVPGARLAALRARHAFGLSMLTNCTHAVALIGTNDLGDGRTFAQVQADLAWLYQSLADRGVQVYGATLLPRTTSTDSWATTANQSAYSAAYAAGSGSARGQLNAWIRGGAGGLLAGYVETADAVETARDSGLWKVNGSANYYTADGTHPTTAGHTAMAPAVNVATFTLA